MKHLPYLTDQDQTGDGLEKNINATDKLRKDLENAVERQRALLPSIDWKEPGLRSTWTYEPTEELGGDILNIFKLGDGIVGFYCLDVVGHGIEASLMADTASHLLSPNSHHSLVKDSEGRPLSPREVLHHLNQEFLFKERGPQFLTITYGIFYLLEKKLIYACGGHPGPVHILKNGEVRRLDHPGFIVGMLPQAEYDEHELYLQEGDRLYLYSDGVPEARNPEGKFFETERLLEILASNLKQGLSASLEEVTLAVKTWCRPAHARDDISLLGFELEPSF
jgi:sigma-B regulation protein RsbU (phosphoserine phosphatase)